MMRDQKSWRRRASATALAAGIAVGLAACGGGGSGGPLVQTADVRFINGAPDLTTVDFSVAGRTFFNGSTYGVVQAYQAVNAGTQSVAVDQAGTSAPIPLPNGPVQIVVPPNARLTVVLAGNASNRTLLVFNEPLYTSTTDAPRAEYNDAAYLTGSARMSFGYVASAGASCASGFTARTTLAVAALPYLDTTIPGSPAQPQPITFCASANGASASFNPSAADPADTQNVMPFPTGLNGGNHLSLYAIDAPAGSPAPFSLVGVFDPAD